MNRVARLIGIGFVMLCSVTLTAQRGTVRLEPPPPSGISRGVAYVPSWRPVGSGPTQVLGSVIDIRQVPIAKVSVRLRDIVTGNVVAIAESNEKGEYLFPDVEPGTYVVEMFIGDRYVVALSNAGSLARNESLQTVVMLPGRWDSARQVVMGIQDFGAFAGLSSANTIAGNTLTIAQDQNIAPSKPGEPVSPSTP